MATSHLVTDHQLTLLGDIDFGHLDDAVGKFIADAGDILLAVVFTQHLFVLDHVVVDQGGHHTVLVFVARPLVWVDDGVVKFHEGLARKLHALGNQLFLEVVEHTGGSRSIKDDQQLVNEFLLQLIQFHLGSGVDSCDILFVFGS